MTVPEPPFLGLGYEATTVSVGSVVNLCFLGFAIKTPVNVEVAGPDGFHSTFQVWVGTNTASDPAGDPLAGASINSPDGTVSWVWRTDYPTGNYAFTATQGDIVLSTVVEVAIGDRLWIEALDFIPPIGSVARFAISGAGPGQDIPLWLYRDTGVIDEENCDLCSIFEWFREVEPVLADEAGAAIVGVVIDHAYEPFDAYCLITSLTEPVCDVFGGGWFEVRP